jgi:uncharacterized protein with WD repeat
VTSVGSYTLTAKSTLDSSVTAEVTISVVQRVGQINTSLPIITGIGGTVSTSASVSWSNPDGSLLSGIDTSVVWSAPEGTITSQDGHEVTYQPPNTAGLYTLTARSTLQPSLTTDVKVLVSSLIGVRHLTWNNDSARLAIGTTTSTAIANTSLSNIYPLAFDIAVPSISGLVWNSDGTQLGGGLFQAWNAASGQNIHSFDWPNADRSRFDWSPDGQFVVVSTHSTDTETGMARVYSVATGMPAYSDLETGSIIDVDWSPDGSSIAVLTEYSTTYTLRIFDAATGSLKSDQNNQPLVATLTKDTYYGGIGRITWSPDGSKLAVLGGGYDAILSIFESSTLTLLRNIEFDRTYQEAEFNTLVWSPDGSHIAIGGCSNDVFTFNPYLLIFKVDTGQNTAAIPLSKTLRAITWSPDGSKLATSDGVGIWLWSTNNWQLIIGF